MSYKKSSKEFTPKELADAFVFPVKLSPKQQRVADQKLAEARKRSLEKMTEKERLTGNLMGLKFRMEDYFKSDKLNSEYSFAYFLMLANKAVMIRRQRKFVTGGISAKS
jgi:hypothetical protein